MAKYLRRKLHLAEGQAYQLSKKHPVGRLLYHLFRNPQEDRQYVISEETHPGRFPLTISHQLNWLNGCRYLSAQGIHDFNRQVEDMMEEEFLTTVKTLAAHSVQFETKAVALRFMDTYDLTEEDMTLDALIKAYYRFRKAQHTAQNRVNNIPNCPALQLQVAA
ncbi:hypothetical protein Q5H92_22830 [Hymenobacter sp. M29]|uniref:Uncharacterized protein n=1 Tax=Hymenobacter mellowenesis TaxID=3063995 RepID=A0ABT9AK86_9BACT|nr:hypothetical protein [Hymenobacter sp. M29]MDO7849217.1 hypothetical protein [Hymenobacter sp. M29]